MFEIELHGTNYNLTTKKRITCQFVPTIELLATCFDRLVPPHLVNGDEQVIMMDLHGKSTWVGGHQEIESLAQAPLTFRKFVENGKTIWMYIGPVKNY